MENISCLDAWIALQVSIDSTEAGGIPAGTPDGQFLTAGQGPCQSARYCRTSSCRSSSLSSLRIRVRAPL